MALGIGDAIKFATNPLNFDSQPKSNPSGCRNVTVGLCAGALAVYNQLSGNCGFMKAVSWSEKGVNWLGGIVEAAVSLPTEGAAGSAVRVAKAVAVGVGVYYMATQGSKAVTSFADKVNGHFAGKKAHTL